MALLELENVHTYYGHIHALKGAVDGAWARAAQDRRLCREAPALASPGR